MRTGLLASLFLTLALAACSGVTALDEAPATPLAGEERASVEAQVGKALEEQRFADAWDQAVRAGAERARLEEIAVAGLAGRSRHAAGMLAALRERHGALTPAARSQVDALVARTRESLRWERALQIELLAADDPPAFARAWALYRAAPPDRGPALLEAIQAARAEHEAAAKEGD